MQLLQNSHPDRIKPVVRCVAVILAPILLLLSGCDSPGQKGTPSEILVEDPAAAAAELIVKKNPCSDLNIPTQITKIGDTYYIVDCYHNEVIYNNSLSDPLSEWNVMTDEMSMGHTLAGDGEVFLLDDTEKDRVMIFEKEGEKYVFSQQFTDITSRPHYIVYDDETGIFYVWCSMSGEMYLFKREKGGRQVYLTGKKSIPSLNGVYVRSFTIIGDEIYFVSGNSNVIKADLETFDIVETIPVPASMAGMVQITPINGEYYITISTDAYWNQAFATIVRCSSLEALSGGDYEDIYHYFIGGGTPYYITAFDDAYFLTEHRIPGHSIWKFTVEGKEIYPQTVY